VIVCILGWQSRSVFADEVAPSSVVISEVMWMGSDLSTSDEWVEVACVGPSDCSVAGWSLTSLKSTGEEGAIMVFAEGASIALGEAKVISHYAASSSRLQAEPWLTTSAMSLPNTKLLLQLRDATGTVRDEVDDGVGNPFAGANPSGGAKASMERIDLSLPGNLLSNWRTATESTGFDPGPEIFGTPGFIFVPQSSSSFSSLSSSESSSSSSSEASSSCSASSQESTSSSSEESSVSSVSSISSSSESSSSSSSEASSLCSSLKESSASSISSSSETSSISSSSSSEASSISSISSASFVSFSESSSSSSTSSASSVSFVLITEVLANPVGADTDEWIEVGNLGLESVDIAGWKLDDGNSIAVFTIPPRSDSAFLLAPGEHVAFRKSVTGLPLDNTGEKISLTDGTTLIDAWSYLETAEGVSYGRDLSAPSDFRPFCVPTEGRPNAVLPLEARIVIQSAGDAAVGAHAVTGTDHISLNLTAEAAGSLASATCLFDFADDTTVQSCNPSSHTFETPGTYPVRLTVRDYCGGFSVQTLTVIVEPEPEEEERESSSSSRKSSSSSHTSSVSVSSISSASSVSFISSVSSASSVVLVSMALPMFVERGITLNEVQMTGAEWIEFFNPTDHEISLAGWTLDDVRDGGSKPWTFPADSAAVGAGEYFVLPVSVTTLKLNDGGDEVWLIAPDGSVSEHVTVPQCKTGTSFSLVDGIWCPSPITPGAENFCLSASARSTASGKKTTAKNSSPLTVKYVTETSPVAESGALVSDVPEELADLVVTGEEEVPEQETSVPLVAEMSVTVLLGTAGAGLFFALRRS